MGSGPTTEEAFGDVFAEDGLSDMPTVRSKEDNRSYRPS